MDQTDFSRLNALNFSGSRIVDEKGAAQNTIHGIHGKHRWKTIGVPKHFARRQSIDQLIELVGRKIERIVHLARGLVAPNDAGCLRKRNVVG